jgi:16S rRNA (uracil1498-N3)-methyltransferase
MRAIYYKYLNSELGSLNLEGDEARHLIKVARIRKDEDVLLLNGEGLVAKAVVTDVSKIEIQLDIKEVETRKRAHNIHLALGLPKRDAFEEILRSSVELGIGKIYFWKSEYSQHDYQQSERYQRILESALIQSNNPFLPELISLSSEEQLFEEIETYSQSFYFCSHAVGPQVLKSQHYKEQLLIIIGPEGGFSPREEKLLEDSESTDSIHLATAILRAPTAVATALGYILALSK